MRPALLAVVISLALSLPSHAQNRVVNVYNWDDYIDHEILEEFTAETGIQINYEVFVSNELLEDKLLAGNSGYDVVVPSHGFLQRQIEAGLFQPLDKSKLPNLVHVWPYISEQTDDFDPGGNYSVNYMWGTTGIGYNAVEVKKRLGFEKVETWDVIFEPEILKNMAECGVTILDAPTEILPAALNYLGHDPTTQDPVKLGEAEMLVRRIMPYVRALDSSDYIDMLAAGEICLTIGWSGDILQARDAAVEGVEVGYVTPEEGAQMWFDQMAIPADARNVDEAHAFINYMLRPEVIAKASNYVYFPNGNISSKPLLDAEVYNDPAVYPPDYVINWLYVLGPYPPALDEAITASWERIAAR